MLYSYFDMKIYSTSWTNATHSFRFFINFFKYFLTIVLSSLPILSTSAKRESKVASLNRESTFSPFIRYSIGTEGGIEHDINGSRQVNEIECLKY